MKEPVLQDKRLQHVKFCKCASELIERVLGKPQNASIEASLERIRKVGHVKASFLVVIYCPRCPREECEGYAFVSVCMSVRSHNSKTIASMDFLHKKYYAHGSVLF